MKADLSRPVDPDRLAELEEERTFLLQSLRDLDAERMAGDVDEHDYLTLRDGYTKRAADVMRQIDDGRARLPARRPARWGRRLAVAGGVGAFAVGAGWLVAQSSGQRLPGQEISGLPANDLAGRLAQARLLLGRDPLQALELYSEVIAERPGHAEAHTYRGWLVFISTSGEGDDVRADAVAAARDDLETAIATDPQYADPHCFLAVIAANYDDDSETARAETDRCLALDPPAEVRALMEPFAADLTTASPPPS